MADHTPYVGAFKPDTETLHIVRAENGGYVVSAVSNRMTEPRVIGAFSNGDDLCRALVYALAQEFPFTVEIPTV